MILKVSVVQESITKQEDVRCPKKIAWSIIEKQSRQIVTWLSSLPEKVNWALCNLEHTCTEVSLGTLTWAWSSSKAEELTQTCLAIPILQLSWSCALRKSDISPCHSTQQQLLAKPLGNMRVLYPATPSVPHCYLIWSVLLDACHNS